MTEFPGATLRRLPRFRLPLAGPVTTGGVIEMPAGDFVQVANGRTVRFVAHLEFRAGTDLWRGTHVHRVRTEWVTVIRGRLHGRFVELASGRRLALDLEPGDQVEVRPGCAHAYRGIGEAAAIECATHDFDPADSEPFAFD